MRFVIGIWIFMLCIMATKSEMSPSLSPIPSVSCSAIIYDMTDCVSFFSSDSIEEKPTRSCCSGFTTVSKTNAECVCEALKSSAELGVDVNLTKASTLPSACQVSAPPVFSQCNIAAADPPSSESSFPNSPQAPAVPGSSETPAPSSSAAAEEIAKHAPSPAMSGTYSVSACFFVLLIMLVISFTYISV